jgi:hypothetical protein
LVDQWDDEYAEMTGNREATDASMNYFLNLYAKSKNALRVKSCDVNFIT